MSDNAAYLHALADLHLCLARAFLPPMAPGFAAAFQSDLVDDLDAIAAELSFACGEPAGFLRDSLQALAGPDHLLQTYSALFLQPPIRVPLNASVHLDGSLLGPSARAMEDAYRRHGLEPSSGLRDLPDHLSRLLEFVGILFARAAGAVEAGDAPSAGMLLGEAREFSASFLRPWLPGVAVDIRGVCIDLDLPMPYQHLAELAVIAVWEGDAWRQGGDAAHASTGRNVRRTPCSACGKPFAEDAAVVAVRRIMDKRGLATAHLDRCPDCRGLADHGPQQTLSLPACSI